MPICVPCFYLTHWFLRAHLNVVIHRAWQICRTFFVECIVQQCPLLTSQYMLYISIYMNIHVRFEENVKLIFCKSKCDYISTPDNVHFIWTSVRWKVRFIFAFTLSYKFVCVCISTNNKNDNFLDNKQQQIQPLVLRSQIKLYLSLRLMSSYQNISSSKILILWMEIHRALLKSKRLSCYSMLRR